MLERMTFMKISRLHIDNFFNNQSLEFDFKISEELKNTKHSKFTVIIGENGTHKTTILSEIYKFLKYEWKMYENRELLYTSATFINNNGTEFYVNKYDSKPDINVIIDSFALIDKLNKSKLYGEQKKSTNFINYSVLPDFINQLIYSNLTSKKKFDSIKQVFRFLGINPDNLILTWSNGIYGGRGSRFYCERIIESDELVHRVDRIMDLISQDDFLFQEFKKFEENYFQKNKGGRFSFKEDLSEGLRYGLSKNQTSYIGKCRFIDQCVQLILRRRIKRNYRGIRAIPFNELRYFIGEDQLFLEIFSFNKDYLERNFFRQLYIDSTSSDENILSYHPYKNSYSLTDLSSGELGTLIRLTKLVSEVKQNSIVLIDEPELHLHPSWMVSYIPRLKKLFDNYNCHFIIATHSPLLVANLQKDDVIVLKKNSHGIIAKNVETGTFGVEVDKILSRIFDVRLLDSSLIKSTFEQIRDLLKSSDREQQIEGMNRLKSLPDSEEKLDVFMTFYDLLMELIND